MSDTETELHEAVNDALDALATHLGGTTETGGPVENATQIKGRGDLGVLLTDVEDRVLGRVWIEFSGDAQAPSISAVAAQEGSVGLHASVCSEAFDPPVPLDEWVQGR